MQFYVPPIFTVILGLLVVGGIFIARVPVIIVGIISLALLVYTFYLHTTLYGIDYRSMSLGEGVKSAAPFILIGAVILMSIGYILMLRKGTSSVPYTPSYNNSANRGFFSSFMPTTTSYFSPSPNRPSSGNYSSSERREYVSALNRLV